MSEPKKMTPEVLRNTLKRLFLHVPKAHEAALRLEAHIAALEKERDAAVADNAAMVKQMTGYAPYLAAHGFDLRGTAFNQPHPGAALLEEHRKALEAAQKALESQQAECHTLRRAFLHERHRADAAGAPPEHAYNARWAENLLSDEHKALVRARNEGLEKAAQMAWTNDPDSALADAIRAMKEPEK